MDKLTQIANKQLHPRREPIAYQVKDLGGNILYQNNSIKLCQHWRKEHCLVNKTFIKTLR